MTTNTSPTPDTAGATTRTAPRPTAAPVTTPGVSVATRDVHLSFGSNHVLQGIALDVPAASTTCVIGPSGSGKSTLLRVVNRLLEPDSGDVLLDGRSVLADDPDRLRQRVGMVFQHFNLFPHKTVRDNITLGLTRLRGLSRVAAAEEALVQLDRVDRLIGPAGAHPPVDVVHQMGEWDGQQQIDQAGGHQR